MANFFIPVKNSGKNNSKIVGNQEISFDEKLNDEIIIGSISNENGQPFIKADLGKKTVSLKFAPNSPALHALQTVDGISKYLKPDGSYEFPLKSITADGRENFTFEIDSINYSFNVTADNFTVTDQNKNKTSIYSSQTPESLFNVSLSPNFFSNINLGKTSANVPKINVTSLPIQTFDFLNANPDYLKANNIEVFNLRNIHLLKINGEIMIARGNSISPLADTKEINRSVYFAEIGDSFHVAFGLEMNSSMQLTEAVGTSGLSQKEVEALKDFMGHTGKTLSQDEYNALKIQAKRLTSYAQTTKKADFSPLPPRPPRKIEDVVPEDWVDVIPTPYDPGPKKNDDTDDTTVEPGPNEEHGLVPTTPHLPETTPEPEPKTPTWQEPPPLDPDGGKNDNENTDGGNNGGETPPPQPEQPQTNPQQPSPQQPAPKKPENKRDVKKDALKVSGILSKLLGFALVVAAAVTPGAIALLAVGMVLFMTGYVSNDVVDLVETFLNYLGNRKERNSNRNPQAQNQRQASQEQEQGEDKTASKEKESEKEDEDLKALPAGEEKLLLTDGKEKELAGDDKLLLEAGNHELEESEVSEDAEDPEISNISNEMMEGLQELHEEHRKIVSEKNTVIQDAEAEIVKETKEISDIEKQIETIKQDERPEAKAMAEKMYQELLEKQTKLAQKQAFLNEQKENIETITETEIKPSLTKIQEKMQEVQDSREDIIAQERDGAIKTGDGEFFYQADNDSSSRGKRKKQNKQQQQATQAAQNIFEQESVIEEESKAQTEQVFEEDNAKQIAKEKQILKEKAQEAIQEQQKLLDKEKGPYAKIKGAVDKIKSLFGKNKTSTQNQDMSQN